MRTSKFYHTLTILILLLTTLLTSNPILTRATWESTSSPDFVSPPEVIQFSSASPGARSTAKPDHLPLFSQKIDRQNLSDSTQGAPTPLTNAGVTGSGARITPAGNEDFIIQPQPVWEKEIWISGDGPFTRAHGPFCDILATDVISIVDSVTVAHACAAFTLTEKWSDSLVFTDVQHISGIVTPTPLPPIPGPGTVTWTVQSAAVDTLYALTKTFTVTTGSGDADYITETLQVDGATPQPADIYLTFWRVFAICVDIYAVDLGFSPSMPKVNTPVNFWDGITPACATLPINYTWDFGGGGAPGGNTTTHIFTAPTAQLPKDFTVTLTAANPCSSKYTSQVITVFPRRNYMPFAANGSE